MLLVPGSADPVVPVTALHDTGKVLKRLGVEVTSHVSKGWGTGWTLLASDSEANSS